MNDVLAARLKMLALLVVSTLLIALRSRIAIILFCAVIIVAIGAINSLKKTKSRFLAIVGVSLFVIIFQVIFNSSVTLMERFIVGGITALRIISLSLLVFSFTETTSPSAIVSALSFLPSWLTLALTISFSLIPAIMKELSSIRLVQEARGFRPTGFNIVRSIFPLLIPLLTRTLTRAEHIALVLETRGFQ